MNVYIVTYDLAHACGGTYKNLIKAIKSQGSAAQIQKSVWVVASSKSHIEIRNALKRSLRSVNRDRIFVGALTSFASCHLTQVAQSIFTSTWT